MRVILTNYGHEYYSIVQSSNGICYFILIESGFSVAYLLKCTSHMQEKIIKRFRAFMRGLEHMLHRVAMLMLMGVVAITLIYPLILADNNLGAVEIRVIPHRKKCQIPPRVI